MAPEIFLRPSTTSAKLDTDNRLFCKPVLHYFVFHETIWNFGNSCVADLTTPVANLTPPMAFLTQLCITLYLEV